MKKSDLFVPHRQSRAAIVLILLKFVRIVFRQFWPVLLVLFIGRSGNFETWLGLLFGVIAIISLTGSVIAYFKFYYFVSEDHLNIHKGVLRTVRLNLPFKRIQTVDFEQNVLHQVFGVVRVRIDSAGSGKEEISFDALSMEEAEILRDYILAQKAELARDGEEQVELSETREPEVRELILQLRPRDLLKIGISQNHLRTAGIIFAFFLAMAENVSDVVKDLDVFAWIGQELESLITGSVIIALIIIPVFLIISFIVTLVRTVLVHFDLSFWKTRTGFKLTSGLLTRREKSAQLDKIQMLKWTSNPLRKLFGIFRLNLYQASSVNVTGDRSMAVPGCYKSHIVKVVNATMPGAADALYEEHHIHPAARNRFILFVGILPCAVLAAAATVWDRPSLYILLLWLPLSIWMGILYYAKRKLHLHPDFALIRAGIFGNDFRLLELYKVQAVRISQSFYQLRKDLATVTLHTASGSVSVPFVPIEKAGQIRDYVLYRVEKDRRSWM